ncbi:FAD/NAD(P)-binding protein [Actinokineospora enzanensis]|uniref:FAD/NAD(P)-binding protein n=1 Tax=Actinokineospora enzanensis TaxID=155975 RepID=UPI00035C9A11|nr:FAD/NAD(P)-binding protein [Actinokineospora enzanensis]
MAIVGAGAAGALTAIRLLAATRTPLHIDLVDPAPHPGRGVAYSTAHHTHLLNVPAGRLSALPDDPDHFARWAAAPPTAFLPRPTYGRYLTEVLAATERRSRFGRLHRVRDRVTAVHPGLALELALASGKRAHVDAAVLALGVFPPDRSWAPPALLDSPRFIADPWQPGALSAIPDDVDVLLVGTGLTMADMVLALDRPHRTITAVSRHGLLPRRHNARLAPPIAPPDLSTAAGLDDLHRTVTRHIRACLRSGQDWRPAMDGLRPLTSTVWRELSPLDQDRFLAIYLREWEVRRHRMPPVVADRLHEARSAGRLCIRRAGVLDATPTPTGLGIRLSGNRFVHVGAVVNCTGPQKRPKAVTDPLVSSLLRAGLTTPGPHGLGFDTDSRGRLSDHPLWTLGALRLGTLWETTAIPEIRAQATEIATDLLSYLATPPDRQTVNLTLGGR